MSQKRSESSMTQLAHPWRTAHRDLHDPSGSQRMIRLANDTTTDPKLATYLYLRGEPVSRLKIVVLDVLDQVLHHGLRQVMPASGRGFHEASLPEREMFVGIDISIPGLRL